MLASKHKQASWKQTHSSFGLFYSQIWRWFNADSQNATGLWLSVYQYTYIRLSVIWLTSFTKPKIADTWKADGSKH